MKDNVIYSYLMETTGIKDVESLEFLLGWLCEKGHQADQNDEYVNLLYDFVQAVKLKEHLGGKNAYFHVTTENGRPRVVGAEISDDPCVEFEPGYDGYVGPALGKEKEYPEEDSVKNIFKRV
ncbi:MAG: hypothetical protein MJZ07_07205, partial [Bacteroidales bacterium]|nr:hypothetical protein [Bacteroidales bacterium]